MSTYYSMRYKNGGTPEDDDYVTHAKYGKGKVRGPASYQNNTIGVRFEDNDVGYRNVIPEALSYTGRYEEPPPPPKRWSLCDQRIKEYHEERRGIQFPTYESDQ